MPCINRGPHDWLHPLEWGDLECARCGRALSRSELAEKPYAWNAIKDAAIMRLGPVHGRRFIEICRENMDLP